MPYCQTNELPQLEGHIVYPTVCLAQVFAPLLLRPVPPTVTEPADVARANWVVAYMIARGNAGGPLATAVQGNREKRSVSVTQQMGQMNVSSEKDAQWYYIDAQVNAWLHPRPDPS